MMPSDPAELPPVIFNHLYIVLDDKTYRAVQASDFLRIAFPGMERRATLTAAGETWSGTYYYCQDNYLEFFGSGNGPVTGTSSPGGHWQAGAQEGWAGLAFSTDQRGGASAVRETVRAAFHYDPAHELRQLNLKEGLLNWFYTVKLGERVGLGSFESWVMEYHPDIFAYKGIPIPPSGELTRQAYLSPWNKDRRPVLPVEKKEPTSPAAAGEPKPVEEKAGQPSPSSATRPAPRGASARGADANPPLSPGTPVFSRVTGATLHMDTRRANRFSEILQLLGYAQETSKTGLTLSAHGFTLTIQPEKSGPPGYRLSSIRLAMARPSVAPMTFVFAPRSRLVLNDNLTADWFFGE